MGAANRWAGTLRDASNRGDALVGQLKNLRVSAFYRSDFFVGELFEALFPLVVRKAPIALVDQHQQIREPAIRQINHLLRACGQRIVFGKVRHLIGDHDNGRFEFASEVFHLGREIRVAPNPSGIFGVQDRKLSAFVELVVDHPPDWTNTQDFPGDRTGGEKFFSANARR